MTREYHAAYRQRQRDRWLRLGIVSPRNELEAAKAERPAPNLERVGSGPLAIWMAA